MTVRIASLPVAGDMPAIAPRAAAAPLPPREAWNASADAWSRLVTPDALVVTTGQQPGLFGGPMYSLHKAIAAAALAAELSDRWNRAVTPVFWLAGDDHDFTEASSAAWIGDDGALHRWSLAPRAGDAVQRPMSQEVLGAEVERGIDAVQASMPRADLDWMRRWWRPGETIHGAFAGAMAELLAPLGVACIDPTHPAFKHAQAPVLRDALHHAAALDAAVAARGDAGTGITAGDGASLVFIETAAGRERLVADGSGFRTRRSGDRFTLADLDRLLVSAPERFSANVLLRPVVEAALLPTVAYVAGPGELRYLVRQASALYPHFDLSPQAPVPRWGGAVIEPWADRLVARLGISIDQVQADDGSLARRILQRDLPPTVAPTLATLRAAVEDAGVALDAAGREIDAVLDRALSGRIRRAQWLIDDIEKLLERHLRRRGDIAHAQYQRLRTALVPEGTPQERILSVGPVYARHGDDWVSAARTAAGAWAATRLETAPLAG